MHRLSVLKTGEWQVVTLLLCASAVLFVCAGWQLHHRHRTAGRANDAVVILECVTAIAILAVQVRRLRR